MGGDGRRRRRPMRPHRLEPAATLRPMTDLDLSRFDVLTFDCYGTLIDWEAGILAGLRAVLDPRGVRADDDVLLEAFARHEAALEAGPYLRYREVLGRALRAV